MFKNSLSVLLLMILVGLHADSAQVNDDLLNKVKDAIRQAEAEGIPSQDQKNKMPYDEAHMSAVLLSIADYFSKPASQALDAKLQFKPKYRDTRDQTRIIRRPTRGDSSHKRLGSEYATVEIKQTDGKPVLESYVISGGDVASIKDICLVCAALSQAIKDTPLDTQNARRYSPALKSLNTLLNNLPKFAAKYLEVEGGWPQKHAVRLAEVESLREQLVRIHKEWLAEMDTVKKATKQAPAPVSE